MEAVNPFYVEANQLRWTLQLVLTATFAAAFVMLSQRLRRPLMGAFGAIWVLHALVALDSLVYWLQVPDVSPSLVVASNTLESLFFGLTAPAVGYATALLIHGEDATRPDTGHIARWVGGMVGVYAAATFTVSAWPEGGATIVALTSRALYITPWALALWAIAQAPDRPRPTALRVFAAGCWLQVIRVSGDAALRLLPWPEGYAAMAGNVTVFGHVLVLLCLGLITMFVSLERERQLVIDQSRQLDAARVREARAERLAGLGHFAGGVAHDFNNVLMVVSGAAEIAQQDPELPPRVQARLRTINEAAARGAAIVRQLMDFARDRRAEVTRFQPADVLSRLGPLLERLVGRQCRVQCQLDGTREIEMDMSAFERVVMNLVSNASDAMPEGGDLTIALTDEDAPSREARPAWHAGAGCVRLSVSDTGRGIPADVLPRILEPFFTTKGASGGTGLGLANVDRIVQDAGGFVTVESVEGAGARFDVWLPQAPSAS